jgi:hypothetical protein
MPYDDDNKVEDIVLLKDKSKEYLNPREEIAYKEFRRDLCEWLLNLGKNPRKAEGYSHATVENVMKSLDLFYRWVWDDEQRYVGTMTTDYADRWMRHLAKRDLKESTKCHYQKAVKMLFKWQCEARNRDVEWEPEIEYSDPSTAYQPREYLTEDDRLTMREAAMSYRSIPHYNGHGRPRRNGSPELSCRRHQNKGQRQCGQRHTDIEQQVLPIIPLLIPDALILRILSVFVSIQGNNKVK